MIVEYSIRSKSEQQKTEDCNYSNADELDLENRRLIIIKNYKFICINSLYVIKLNSYTSNKSNNKLLVPTDNVSDRKETAGVLLL